MTKRLIDLDDDLLALRRRNSRHRAYRTPFASHCSKPQRRLLARARSHG
jgi:hypothetical protein